MSNIADFMSEKREEIESVERALRVHNDSISIANVLALNAVLLMDIRFILTEMLTYQQQDRGLRP